MLKQRLSALFRLLALGALALAACAAPATPPTATPTLPPPTATALPATPTAQALATQLVDAPHVATAFKLDSPTGLAFDADDNLYVAKCGAGVDQILKIDPSGLLTIYAGTDTSGFSGDGGPARSVALACPLGLAFDRDGNLYVADNNNHRVRRIDRTGMISTVAGSGPVGVDSLGNSLPGDFAGDGGPATAARLSYPFDVAIGPDGSLYIADAGNNRVRKVDKQGLITTIAGSGDAPGFSGDGGPATRAQLNCYNQVMGMAIDGDGNVYISDNGNYRIRKIDKLGIITTIAGNGQAGSTGDGGPATAASLTSPIFLAADAQGNLYFSEWPGAGVDSNRVRKVDKQGIITTVAGRGERGSSGDGGPAILAALFYPNGLAFDREGNLYIADNGNNRVRKVDQQGIITTVAGGKP